MALTKITPQMFDTSAAGHDFNIDNGTFVVDASANRVGIGTATPSTLLDVNGTLTATSIAGTLTTAAQTNITSVGTLTGLVVNGNASIQTGALTLSGANPPLSISNSGDAKVNFVRSSNTISYALSSAASGGHGFYDNAASAYDLYMKAGKVGIGTTSPGYPLEISAEGTVSFAYQRTGTGVTAKKWGFHSDNSNTYWQNITDSLLALTISNGGNVGIGTTNPADALHILDTSGHAYASVARSTQSQGEVGLRLRGGTSGNDWYIYQKPSNNNLNFYNTSDRMTIDSSGNVGIGTTSPNSRLHVVHPLSEYTTSLAETTTKSTLQLKTHAGDSTITTFGGVSGGHAYIQRSNGPGTTPYAILLNPYGGNVGIGTSSPYSKLNVQGTSASTYTGSGPGTTIRASQSTDGNWIASDVDGKFAYFGVDGDNGKFAAYNYVSNAEMGVIIGQDTFKVVSEQAGIIQSDGDYVAKLHSTSADGYLSLYIGTATPTLKTKISSYGTSFFNSTTGQTAANQALVSIGAQTGKKAGYLNIDSAATSTSGGIRHKMSQGTQYLNVSSIHTASGSLPYWHIKTNIYYNQNIMFVARVHGYSYGNSGHIVDMQRSGYAYNGSSTSLVGSQFVNNGSFSSATLECYYTGAGQLCFRAYAGASSYYTGWAFDIKMQSPTGYNHDFVVDAHNMNATSGNYYT